MSQAQVLTYHLAKTNNSVPMAHQTQYLTREECDQILNLGLNAPAVESYLSNGRVDNTIRKNLVAFLPSSDAKFNWLHERLSQTIIEWNKQFWNYDVDFIETLQFTRYDRLGDFYDHHMDMNFKTMPTRKLSFSIQLSDPETYTGSDLLILNYSSNYYTTIREQGSLIMFPSFMIHKVTPLLSGARYSLVGWIKGPPFR